MWEDGGGTDRHGKEWSWERLKVKAKQSDGGKGRKQLNTTLDFKSLHFSSQRYWSSWQENWESIGKDTMHSVRIVFPKLLEHKSYSWRVLKTQISKSHLRSTESESAGQDLGSYWLPKTPCDFYDQISMIITCKLRYAEFWIGKWSMQAENAWKKVEMRHQKPEGRS